MKAETDSRSLAETNGPHKLSDDIDAWHMAKMSLELAQELEATERRIKEEVLRAVNAGELTRVRDLVTRWIKGPVCEVLADGAKDGQNPK